VPWSSAPVKVMLSSFVDVETMCVRWRRFRV
jgi:hypothetical protein